MWRDSGGSRLRWQSQQFGDCGQQIAAAAEHLYACCPAVEGPNPERDVDFRFGTGCSKLLWQVSTEPSEARYDQCGFLSGVDEGVLQGSESVQHGCECFGRFAASGCEYQQVRFVDAVSDGVGRQTAAESTAGFREF